MQRSIFVQLASYRDPQLIPTIEDLLSKAKYPEMFTFGICWQYDDTEYPYYFDHDDRFRVKRYHYTESKGLGWARNITNTLYNGEQFTLQLDSHHRFAKHWDVMLLQDYFQASTMSEKPIISTYCTPFNPYSNEKLKELPSIMSQYEFSMDKLLMSMPYYIQDHTTRSRVIRNRTLSGHFFFVDGKFIQEVPYDPQIYFGGYTEETTMSLRAFTWGYDIYAPYRQYIWHEYSRSYRVKHWDDHGIKSEDKPYVEETSGDRDTISRNRTRQLFEQEDHGYNFGMYGTGSIRTLKDYEIFGGFDFKNCRMHKATLDVEEPPNATTEEEWFSKFTRNIYTVTCNWDVNKLQSDLTDDDEFDFIALGVEGGDKTLARIDFTPKTHDSVFTYEMTSFTFEFDSITTPTRWVLSPHLKSGNWGTRQEGTINL
jgi:hypothetical protein